MTTVAADLLAHLQALGCACRLDGDILHVSPRALLTPELQAQIREHKAALIDLLAPLPVVDDDPGPWGFHSRLLNETIWLCQTEADVAALRAEGAVGYLFAEVRELMAMRTRDPDGIQAKATAIHRNKQVWDASIDGVELPKEAKEHA